MRGYKIIAFLSPAVLFLYGYTLVQQKNPVQELLMNHNVEGQVISGRDGKPVSNAHVYIVHGEEEALTNQHGEFRISTAKKLPVVVTVDHRDHEKTRVTVSGTGHRVLIKLKSKQE